MSVAKTLNAALEEKEMSISGLAKLTGLNRSFLSRLFSGQTPPYTREGRRSARHDERYQTLVDALDLDPTFIGDVEREQNRDSTTSLLALKLRHREFVSQIYGNVEQRVGSPLRLAYDCLEKKAAPDNVRAIKTLLERRLREPRIDYERIKSSPVVGRDHLGFLAVPPPPRRKRSKRAQQYLDVARALLEIETAEEPSLRAQIADVLSDVATLIESGEIASR